MGLSRSSRRERDLLKPPFASNKQYCCCEFSFLKISRLVDHTTTREEGSPSSLPIHSNTAVSILVEERECGTYTKGRETDPLLLFFGIHFILTFGGCCCSLAKTPKKKEENTARNAREANSLLTLPVVAYIRRRHRLTRTIESHYSKEIFYHTPGKGFSASARSVAWQVFLFCLWFLGWG